MSPKYHIEHNSETKASQDATRPWLLIRTTSMGTKYVVGRYKTKASAQRRMNQAAGD